MSVPSTKDKNQEEVPSTKDTIEPDTSSNPDAVVPTSGEQEGPIASSNTAKGQDEPSPFRECIHSFNHCTHQIQNVILAGVVALSMKAARNPKSTIVFIIVLSFGLMGVGLSTNFHVELDEDKMFAQSDSPLRERGQTVEESFPQTNRPAFIALHKNGENMLTYDAIDTFFMALEAMRSVDSFYDFCGLEGCELLGVPRWWDNNATLFREQTQGSDELTRQRLCNHTWSDGTLIQHDFFFGYFERDNEGNCISAQSTAMSMGLPEVGANGQDAMDLELLLIDALLTLREQIQQDPNNPHSLEFTFLRSYADEAMRAIAKDIPLIPFVIVIMTLFTCSIFYRKDKVQSRTLLGIGSVFTIVMSLMSGFGFSFVVGIPFTSITQLLPFVVFGVGLDDTFIITGAYLRTDPSKDTIDRVEETMTEVGNSIGLTTITTTIAFMMGCSTSIPSIRWLCLYAFITIVIDFLYQITLFIAIVVLDERRIQSGRRDFCCCLTAEDNAEASPSTQQEPKSSNHKSGTAAEVESQASSSVSQQQQSATATTAANEDENDANHGNDAPRAPLPDRVMSWYADRLLQPEVKVFVIFLFGAFLAGCAYSATLLEQKFDTREFMPDDSYVISLSDAMLEYRGWLFRFSFYFRDVDQADPEVQEQMISFLNDMVALPEFGIEPELCWVNDLKKLRNGEFNDEDLLAEFEDYTWVLDDNKTTEMEKLNFLLRIPEVDSLYGNDIVFGDNGEIEISRCGLTVSDLDESNVKELMQFYLDMKEVMANNPVNMGRDVYAFFTFDALLYLWDFFLVAIDELTFTTISGVIAVSVIGFLLIPHYTAILFVTPLIIILYIDLLGAIQFGGLYINPITYVCLVISIGLLVDFLMHFLLRFYESTETTRDEKVKDSLRTIGSSILVGGLSTLLGVVPLAFSTSAIMRTVFTCFLAMISLGVTHGLILLPVLLSYCGPEVCVKTHYQTQKEANEKEGEKAPVDQVPVSDHEVDVDAANEKPESSGPGSPMSIEC